MGGGEREDEELGEAVAAALRQPKRGDLEQILASNLAAAVFAPPLEKIRMILEAFLLLPEEEQRKIAVGEGEAQYIREIYEVAVSLSNAVEVGSPTPHMRGRFAAVPWSFSVTQADRYLRHFVNRIWELGDGEDWRRLLARLKTGGDSEAWSMYLRELAKWLASGFAPLPVVEQVKNEFAVRVMPYASMLLREIFTSYITKETWEVMLGLMGGGRRSRRP
jgi:hypothetical protein